MPVPADRPADRVSARQADPDDQDRGQDDQELVDHVFPDGSGAGR
jgi:hypothetical protein